MNEPKDYTAEELEEMYTRLPLWVQQGIVRRHDTLASVSPVVANEMLIQQIVAAAKGYKLPSPTGRTSSKAPNPTGLAGIPDPGDVWPTDVLRPAPVGCEDCKPSGLPGWVEGFQGFYACDCHPNPPAKGSVLTKQEATEWDA